MEELINNLAEKVGLDRGTAEKVADFIKDHASEIPGWIAQSGLADKLPGGLGDTLSGLLGGDKD
ncbi:MAG TPA: hypothetical protein PLX06_09020 [Fimbriimonadaceae bacterium]|nr:hypothetical protein [Fimbriimonadaceae bacterium]